ncbi:hypothetical protein IFO70_10465 [Phormidium tenue FACHB-886]|nr:hypothetical protein [Phormidium tenue FACHB-886]
MLRLSIASFNVQIDKFLGAQQPRTRVNIGSVTYTAAGVAVGKGTWFEPFHQWDVQAIVTETQMKQLKLIYAEHEYWRERHTAEAEANANVMIWDTTQFYEERLPRSRAVAPPIVVGNETLCDTTPEMFPAVNPTHTLYFARFAAWFSTEPQFSKGYRNPNLFQARFILQETDRVPA